MAVTERSISTRELSYASSARSRSGKALVRLIENSTGRHALLKRVRGYEEEIASGANFFDVMVARYGLELDVVRGALGDIPPDGPLIVIANHPYGILDGLVMGHILNQTRGDFKILANSVFNRGPDLQSHILPISFDEDRAAVALNLATRREALSYLRAGGAIGIFPGGTVSTGAKPFSRPMDPSWRNFTARLIAKSNATVLPIYFDGHTSRMFQIASHMHATLRLGLLIKEFHSRVDMPVRLSIGKPISRAQLEPLVPVVKGMMDFLRKATYELAPEPLDSFDAGYDFEDRRRRR